MNNNNTSLLNENILNSKLYNDIKLLCQNDSKLNPDIYIVSYLWVTSFFCSNKIQLQINQQHPTNSNLYFIVAGNSGKGKSYTSKLFRKPIHQLQMKLRENYKSEKQFVNHCIKKYDTNQEIDKESIVNEYNEINNTNFDTFKLKNPKEHLLYITQFTPQGVSKILGHKLTNNSSILTYSDELEKLIKSITRTNGSSEYESYLIGFFDGDDDIDVIKTEDSLGWENGCISLLTNTTLPKFQRKIKERNWFESGLGYRFNYYVNYDTNLNQPERQEATDSLKSYYLNHQEKLSTIINEYFFKSVYNNKENTILHINDNILLNVYYDERDRLWDKFVKNNDNLNISEKSIIDSRFEMMFQKFILNTYIMNYSYTNMYDKTNYNLTIDDIIKGSKMYEVFLEILNNLDEQDEVSDLSNTRKSVIELIGIGDEIELLQLKKQALKLKLMNKSNLNKMFKIQSNSFTLFSKKDSSTNYKEVQILRREL